MFQNVSKRASSRDLARLVKYMTTLHAHTRLREKCKKDIEIPGVDVIKINQNYLPRYWKERKSTENKVIHMASKMPTLSQQGVPMESIN